jgi:hypothetical protein
MEKVKRSLRETGFFYCDIDMTTFDDPLEQIKASRD